MKAAPIKQILNLGVSVTLAILAWLLPSHASASTNFVYDLYKISPDVLPQNLPSSPWTVGGGNGPGAVSDPSNILTLNDPNPGGAGPYFGHALTVPEISSTSAYEMRARVRVTSQTAPTSFLFYEDISDGTRYLGWAMQRTNSLSRFWVINTAGLPIDGTTVDIAGSDFFQVDLKKTGTTGTGADGVVLSVNNIPIISMSYTNLTLYAPRSIDFGNGSTPGVGISELTGVSFGINELAPELLDFQPVPEPSILALAGLAAVLIKLRRRQQS